MINYSQGETEKNVINMSPTGTSYNSYIKKTVQNHIAAIEDFFAKNEENIIAITHTCAEAFRNGHKIMLCGNGGSAADAQHIAAELVGRLHKERIPLPAIALTTDTSALTCIGNDYGFEHIFSRQVEGLAREGDVLFAISTSGNSGNVVNATQAAYKLGVKVINVTGKCGGVMKRTSHAAHTLHVDSLETQHIQECHMVALHLICDLIEKELGLVEPSSEFFGNSITENLTKIS